MTAFLSDDFLLHTESARRLYHDHAAGRPIIDYHSHLPAEEIAADRRFANLTELWLEGDHYKWRAMRLAGVDERLITGDASDREKFDAFAQTMPLCIGNPLYHWTHLELARLLDLPDVLLGSDTAERVWQHGLAKLAEPGCSARGLLLRSNVRMIGTTDDPVDNLAAHAALAASSRFPCTVRPTFRPDRVLKIGAAGYPDYIRKLERAADTEIRSLNDLYTALTRRLDHFAAHGCVSADHGLDHLCFSTKASESQADRVLRERLEGGAPTEPAGEAFASVLLAWFGRAYEERGWVQQLHIGAQRDNNSRMRALLGPNAGFDSIGDQPFARPLAALLDTLDRDGVLPKTILYCLNPSDNEVVATMAGNFAGAGVRGKVQFGAAWWFNDQRDGIVRQLNTVSQMGLLGGFVGMLTDSRSFLSMTRHEYFRRLLCDLVGGWVERGEAPADDDLLGNLIEDVCWRNAARYFGLPECADALAAAAPPASTSGDDAAASASV